VLRGLLNFPALQAGGADPDALGRALHHRVNLLQIQVPAPLRQVVGMADLVAEPGTAAANIAHLRHLGDTPGVLYFLQQSSTGREPARPPIGL
jgi:hypothetical protein